jgi:hypothetical protein
VVATHEGHTGALDSTPKEQQLPRPLNLHGFFHKSFCSSSPTQTRFRFHPHVLERIIRRSETRPPWDQTRVGKEKNERERERERVGLLKEERNLYTERRMDGKEEGDELCKGRSSAFLEF